MLAEMEFTGQAFEEMQEQNVRLLQQLREKDDANLKLMSEVRKFHFKYVINDNLGGFSAPLSALLGAFPR